MSALHDCPKRADAGFSVMEAMVAVALLAAALIPLLSLQSQFVRTVDSFERAEARISARQEAVEYLRTVNFALHPRGEIDMGGKTIIWAPVGQTLMRAVVDAGGRQTRYSASLHAVTVTVRNFEAEKGAIVFQYSGLGWRPDKPYSKVIF